MENEENMEEPGRHQAGDEELSGVHATTRWPRRIVLTGFRGTGKTSVGRRLARILGYDFLDTDQVLEERLGSTIAAFVQENGWDAFRRAERELLEELARVRRVVVATGGGAISHRDAWERLRQGGFVVWLQADGTVIGRRLAADPVSAAQRPPLSSEDPEREIEEQLALRTPLYAAGSDLAVDSACLTPEAIVTLIHEQLAGRSARCSQP
ncbi:shikimate kinase [Desulfolithobacter sp.]